MPPETRHRLARLAGHATVTAAVVTTGTGLLLIPLGVHTPGYFAILRVHLACGVALVVAALLALAMLAWARHLTLRDWLLPAAALAFLWALLTALLNDVAGSDLFGQECLSTMVWSIKGSREANLLTQMTVAAALIATGTLAIRDAAARQRWFLLAASAAAISAVLTGALAPGGMPRVPGIDAVHSLAGVSLPLLVLGYRFLARRPGRPAAVIASLMLLALGVVAWGAGYRAEHGRFAVPDHDDRSVVLATLPASRAEMLDHGRPRIRANLLIGSARCGGPQCHPQQTDQWAGSTHRYAADNRLFRTVVGTMVGELGPHSASACMNCHDPVRVLAGSVAADWADGPPEPIAEGVGCIVCHSIVAVPHPAKNGVFTVAAPLPYPGDTQEEQEANLLLDPRAHARAFFRKPTILRDPLCVTCHSLEMTPDTWASAHLQLAIPHDAQRGYAPGRPGHGLDCTDCHMPVSRVPRDELPFIYDHEMPALNPDLPLYAVGPDSDGPAMVRVASYARDYLLGTLQRVPSRGPYPADANGAANPDQRAFSVLRKGLLLGVAIDAQWQGDALQLAVQTHNHRSAHDYPSGSRDFRQVWQEIRVDDASGRRLAHIGGLDAEGRLDPDAHTLGATVLDINGQPLREHRVWEAKTARDVRKIAPGGQTTDRYRLTLPADARPPLQVEVLWNLRHASLDFTRYTLGKTAAPFPVHLLGRAALSLDGPAPAMPSSDAR